MAEIKGVLRKILSAGRTSSGWPRKNPCIGIHPILQQGRKTTTKRVACVDLSEVLAVVVYMLCRPIVSWQTIEVIVN